MKTTWREQIEEAMQEHGESFAAVVSCTLEPAQLDAPFDNDYGGHQGAPFTLWTTRRVYFPCVYDGAEWCGSVARDPDGKPTAHIGCE
jgi:hypothetical protein